MVERNGYEMESHNVVTEDGYILTVFRLTSSLEGNNEKKQPVYVEHGIFLNCDTWTFVGQRSLGKSSSYFKNILLNLFPAYSLVDDGYDVWLGNQRGNRYSREHNYLKYTDSEYWDFK
jgi:pimeloyl-ACP methyl ester carboxylesterase